MSPFVEEACVRCGKKFKFDPEDQTSYTEIGPMGPVCREHFNRAVGVVAEQAEMAMSEEKKAKSEGKLPETANPEYVNKLISSLGHPVSPAKSPQNYNTKWFTSFDQVIHHLVLAGVRNATARDVMMREFVGEKMGESSLAPYIRDRIQNGHSHFPHTSYLSSVLLGVFKLKSEKDDSVESLLDKATSLQSKFCSHDDWQVILKAAEGAKNRLRSQSVAFVRGHFTEQLGEKGDNLAKEDTGLSQDYDLDIRAGDHNVLALKELVCLMQGEAAVPYTVGSAFFASQMPELDAQGISAVILEFSKDKLSGIRLVKKTKHIDDSSADEVPFGPFLSGAALVRSYGRGNVAKDGVYYHVVVNSAVSGDKSHAANFSLGKGLRFKPEVIHSAEVFLFQKVKEGDAPEKERSEMFSTRLFFVPENWADVHPSNQNALGIIPHSEHNYFSCMRDKSGKVTKSIIQKYAKISKKSEDEALKMNTFAEEHSPGTVFFRMLHPNVKSQDLLDSPEYHEERLRLFKNEYGVFRGTILSIIGAVLSDSLEFSKLISKEGGIARAASDFDSLQSRLDLKSLWEKNHGLEYAKPQESQLNRARDVLKVKEGIEDIVEINKLLAEIEEEKNKKKN